YVPDPKKIFSIEGNFQGIDMASLEKTMKIGLSALEGTGKARVALTGSGENSKRFKETLNGEISLQVQNGRLHKFLILSKIFSLLNLKVLNMSSKGMSYDSITANVVINNGIVRTNSFLLDSNSFRMTGVGEIDLGKSKIDMVLGVQPFQTLDKVISNIPVIGKVLTGKKKSLIVSYYSVKGDLKNPVIKAKPVESVGKGVLGILKRVITLPKDLITGGEK
ncbi:MAG: AsmA-like C-terminal domain-containing protein, partial [Nitrospinota bacterium]